MLCRVVLCCDFSCVVRCCVVLCCGVFCGVVFTKPCSYNSYGSRDRSSVVARKV